MNLIKISSKQLSLIKKIVNKQSTIFDQIIAKKIKSEIIYEDEEVIAFNDICPQAPVHVLVIPKSKGNLDMLSNAKEEDITQLGNLLYKAQMIATQNLLLKNGFRLVINNGNHAGQTVYHLHIHILGGKPLMSLCFN